MFRKVCALACLCVLMSATSARAQGYFGQNKVQYQTFQFKVLKTQHFDIYYYPQEEQAARMASRMAERWYTRLSTIFNHQLKNRQIVVLYASGSQFRQTNVVEGDLGEGTGGVTEAYKRRIVLPFAGPIQATDHVLGHELVHAFQYDSTNTSATAAGAGYEGALSLPLWFIEGMAEYLSLGPDDPNTAMWMREAVRENKLPDIDHLDNPKYFPYRYGEALWAYVGGKYGDNVIPKILKASLGRDGYKSGFQRVLGISSKDLSKAWHDATVTAYRPVQETTKMPSAFATPVIVDATKDQGMMNVSPELSPDGSKIMFFSSRDLFSIDLFVANAQTGKVERRITNTATNAHLDSIEFIESAGAWSHDGTRFVFPELSGGHPSLAIVDVDNGKRERNIQLKDVDEVLNPTWSPDGNEIAFSGLVGGFDDLFIYDLKTNQLHRLTNDAFAELEPAWSPDGKSIAFCTDRFTTKLNDLGAGNLQLAIMDVATGTIRTAGGFQNAKNINPQWDPKGGAIFFISDRDGISNVYRLDLDTNQTTQVTNLLTGASGITDLSPAISMSRSRLAFSVYENNGYDIYSLPTGPKTVGESALNELPYDAGLLPPRRQGEGTIFAYLQNDTAGLPAVQAVDALKPQPYKPHMTLDFLGQPTVGVGVDPFGTYAAGGISAQFSDVLGDHVLAMNAQITSRFDEAGGSLMYLNRTHRWNWGAAVDQTPYVLAGVSDTLTTDANGNPLIAEDLDRIVQTDRGFSGIAIYPFNRAQRVEFTGGLRQITGHVDVQETLFDYFSGQALSQNTTRLSTFPTLNLGTASSALVYDTSIFGATSPIRGSRYRLEADETAGGLNYETGLADFRTYLMPVRPFTIALRGMYYSRFGRDSENSLLTPVFIGYPQLVRGYDSNSFQAQECGNTTDGSCPVFDKLLGSRMLIGNAELRFPVWGAFGGSNFYGPLPIELGVFADAGAAWGRSTPLRLSGSNNDLVRSVGIVTRVNLLGFAVAEIDYVRPLDRPLRGWMWEFNLMPGF